MTTETTTAAEAVGPGKGTGGQWLRGAVHSHAEGESALGADLRHRRATAPGAAGVPRHPQHHLAHPAARTPDTSPRPASPAFPCGTRRVSSFMVSHQPGPLQTFAISDDIALTRREEE